MGHILDQQRVSLHGGGVYKFKVEYDGSNNPIYMGTALPGSATSDPKWQIRKLTFDGSNNPTDMQYANGSIEFDKIWDDRASLAYS